MQKTKKSFLKRQMRMRWNLKKKNPTKVRLCVFRSNQHVGAQLIDDQKGITLCAISSLQKGFEKGGNREGAEALGMAMGEKIKAQKVESFYFDRGGYLYHGRIKAFAEGVRKAGLEF